MTKTKICGEVDHKYQRHEGIQISLQNLYGVAVKSIGTFEKKNRLNSYDCVDKTVKKN